ncbi:MAG: hypothetical protein IJ562_01035 [Prevotella sp.]|nr:hypothetical protein [Prevotella sp.]
MPKTVKAVAPYLNPHGINFKTSAFEAWVKAGGLVAESHYPPRWAHHFAYRFELPTLFKNKKEARLRFVEPVSMSFDTYPDYCRYEIIPFIWDCWPKYFKKVCAWFIKHDVKTAIFTSSQAADRMRARFPQMNILYVPEGIDTSIYEDGKPLNERTIDILEFGRSNKRVFDIQFPETINHLRSNGGKHLFESDDAFRSALADTKICILFPRCDTQPEVAGDIETLTQRYWECMLSRCIMLGRAPKELIKLIGYNPVIELDKGTKNEQIISILSDINSYQGLVDRNRSIAIERSDWKIRMSRVCEFLLEYGYKC